MSLLFYRRPDYLGRSSARPELGESLCASHMESAEANKSRIPDQLSFENIVKNTTLPPCSLNDFMDYLMYIEYNAECLQFFLWYCDYVERWSHLPKEARDLSPIWQSNGALNRRHRPPPLWESGDMTLTKPKHARTNSFTQKVERLNRILTIMETSPQHEKKGSKPLGRKPQRADSSSTNFSWPRTKSWDTDPPSDASSHGTQTSQPFREEMSRVINHYISTGAPRQLNLTHQDRTKCTQAVEQTTHPSALLPAFVAAEAVLRGQSHPNFIKWSLSNCNRPRVVLVWGLSAILILLGFVLATLLVLSSLSPYLRLLATPLWCLGFSKSIAARHGICVILHFNAKRNLRPWEQFEDEEMAGGNKEARKGAHKHKRSDADSSITSSRLDPLRKQSLQSFGSANSFESEPWVGIYHERPVWKRIFDVTILAQNRPLRAMQDRIVLKAALCGSFGASALGLGSVFIPSAGLF
ncbi:hypothetical protein BJ170DRAFT_678095 [Xylariales sp. AK1849]|nr:hypothetical protein BJ170DRAFT_678095 [Xylariales sp. AK1849]